MYSVKKIFSLLLTFLFVAAPAHSAEVISKIDPAFEKSDAYRLLNNQIRKGLNLPFYFNVPFTAFSPLSEDILNSRTSKLANPPILLNYRESRTSLKGSQRALENTLGLRLIAVNGTESRTQTSQTLAESGLIQTGDILLSFRPEWFGTLRYSHIQLGVSHAGIAIVDQDPTGRKYVYNLDMPLDAEYNGRMDSKHYQELNMMHVLRLKDMNETQKANLIKWYRLIRDKRASIYPSQMFFNKDYANPKYRADEPMTFVGDLGRMALGYKIQQQQSMYCSEFSWSLLSLRNCDPERDAGQFSSQSQPVCITKAFEPMPVFGNLYDAKTDGAQVVGMSDGPMILADVIGAQGKARQELIHQAVFVKSDGKPENISSGHRAVEEGLLKANPQIYQAFEGYYSLTFPGSAQHLPAEMAAQRAAIKQGFNSTMNPNYSPTSFQMHAILPPSFNGVTISAKKVDYVGTVGFFKPIVLNGKKVDVYQALKAAK